MSVVISRLGTNITAEVTPRPSINGTSASRGQNPTAVVASPYTVVPIAIIATREKRSERRPNGYESSANGSMNAAIKSPICAESNPWIRDRKSENVVV